METSLDQPALSGKSPLPIAKFVPDWLDPGRDDGRLRLHIGGHQRRPGWRVLDIQAGPNVDFVGDCRDLSQFGDGSVSAVYASHVIEHLSHRIELPQALAEIRRILSKEGVFLMSVPDLAVLCQLFVDPSLSYNERAFVMFIMFGGQLDPHDFHHVGLWQEYVGRMLAEAGFRQVNQVGQFGLFQDSSTAHVRGRYISLNVIVS
jgi:predicted SAM-dependent methyltransferase